LEKQIGGKDYFIYWKKYYKNMGYGGTAPNRSVYASPPVGGSGYEKPQSACGLGAVFLRHIFAVAGNLRFPLSQPQKRHIQPERYVQYPLNWLTKIKNDIIIVLEEK
jgi:hypothetical protein